MWTILVYFFCMASLLLQIYDVASFQHIALIAFVVFCQLSPTKFCLLTNALKGIAIASYNVVVLIVHLYRMQCATI